MGAKHPDRLAHLHNEVVLLQSLLRYIRKAKEGEDSDERRETLAHLETQIEKSSP